MTVTNKPGKNVATRAHRSEKKGSAATTASTGAAATVAATDGAEGEPNAMAGRDMLVPLDRLVLSQANVRKVHREDGLLELAALIEAQGLLQRLSIVADGKGRFGVVAGGRRLRAMQMLVATGRWPAEQPIECKLYPHAQAVQVSLAENSGREDMHPADQMEAFARLIDEGLTVGQVAGRFGVSSLTVERRLKLARLAPRFLDLYRAEEIEPEQLQALALIDDPARQEAVWDGLSVHDRSAWRIRSVITAEACSADHRLARFVGLEVYEAAGGAVRRDLFSSPDDLSGIYLDDAELLRSLAAEKMKGLAVALKEEGWAWVECSLASDTLVLRGFGRERQVAREATPEEAALIEQMEVEQRMHSDAYERHQNEGDPDAEGFDRIEQQLCEAVDIAEEKLMAARASLMQWTPEHMACTGVLVRLDHRGEVLCDYGLIRPGERKTQDRTGLTDRHGDSEDAGGDDERQPGDATTAARPEFSEKLMRDLTAHRTAALQAALVQNPHVALVTLVHRMAETVFGLYGRGDDVVKVSVRQTSDTALAELATDYADSPAAAVLGDAQTLWGDRLPGSPDAAFRWLLAQPQATLLELLAYCTARSINVVTVQPRTRNHSDAVADALDLDMADWWTPTAAKYFGSVSKAKALEAVREETGVDDTKAVSGMKKPEAVAYCASKLDGTRWLPTPLQSSPTSETKAQATEQI